MKPAHMALMRSVRFAGIKVGIEFTTIPPSLRDGRRDHDWQAEQVVNRVREVIGHTQLVEKVHDDPGVVEISSTILRNWGSVASFYKLARDATDKHKCKPESPYQIGGGGHIHISAKGWPTTGSCATEAEPTAVKIHNWCYDRPWICWAFNDPSDNDTAVLRHTHWDNSSAINDRWDNIELRFFDAAESVEEQVEHVVFALKLLRLGCSLPEGDTLVKKHGRLPKLTLQQALAGWKNTVEQLGLPWNLYKKYSRNIRERYQLGPRYLN